MSRAAFATCPVFAPAAIAPSSSLFNSLKKKKKESEEWRGIGPNVTPRVGVDLPSIWHAAYFLGHELHEPETPEWWQLMAREALKIKGLDSITMQTTCPRVALPVLPPRHTQERSR
ncbi:hypothetical protein [Trinickia terrae]|uniref:hypothetical protein n=1 Tax=Trinickia terrae TaxID=2571161 RepID=UPI00197FEE61|nr:hypothetical protein [Trinickia terrae]